MYGATRESLKALAFNYTNYASIPSMDKRDLKSRYLEEKALDDNLQSCLNDVSAHMILRDAKSISFEKFLDCFDVDYELEEMWRECQPSNAEMSQFKKDEAADAELSTY